MKRFLLFSAASLTLASCALVESSNLVPLNTAASNNVEAVVEPEPTHDELVAELQAKYAHLTAEEMMAEVKSLPASYNPYITEPSAEADALFEYYRDEFSDMDRIQADRVPQTREYFIRRYFEDPMSLAQAPNENPYEESMLPYYFSSWDQRWANNIYSGGEMAQTGCAPTALSIIYVSLTGDFSMTPDAMAEFATNNGYAVPGYGTAWTLMDEGASMLGLQVESLGLDEHLMRDVVQGGRPIMMIMGPGHFTSSGHFLVIHGIDENGDFMIYDPFNITNNTSYSFDFFADQVQNLWAYSY